MIVTLATKFHYLTRGATSDAVYKAVDDATLNDIRHFIVNDNVVGRAVDEATHTAVTAHAGVVIS